MRSFSHSTRSTPRRANVPLLGDLTVIRPAAEDDADLLVGWHADPEVARYWDNEQFTRDEMLLRLASPEADAYIVEADEKPVGYLQAWFDGEQPGRGGIDMFLIPLARGRGLGPDAARTLAEYLLTGGQTHVTVDPYVPTRSRFERGRRLASNRSRNTDPTASTASLGS
jgi:aminoglycoside 6'-N-acetyltransferase